VPEAFDAFRYAHDRRRDVIWLSQNTNHLVPPEVVRGALETAIAERRYEGYPRAAAEPELLDLVRADLGLRGAVPFVTGGGTEALYMITRALLAPGDEVVASDPSYLIIHRFIELAGAVPVCADIYRPPFRLTAEAVAAHIGPRTKMILLIDPLNPLGTGYPRDEVRAIAELAHDHHLTLINDVTYRDFSDGHALAAPFAPEQTVTIWSVSKNCGLAGLRLGGFSARPELAKPIARFNTNDLGVNILAQVAARAALRSKPNWIDSVVRTTRENGRRVQEVGRSVPGVTTPTGPSRANMTILDIAGTGLTPEAIQEELLRQHGLFVRSGSYLSPAHGQRFVRVSFSNPPEQIARFAEAFPAALRALSARPAVAR
jgi:aspartate aminotransferase